VTPSEFREHLDIHKTRMNGLSCGEESMTIYSAVICSLYNVYLLCLVRLPQLAVKGRRGRCGDR